MPRQADVEHNLDAEIVIDTTKPLEDCIAELLAHLDP